MTRENLIPKWVPPKQPWFPVVDRSKPPPNTDSAVGSPATAQSEESQPVLDLGDIYSLPPPEKASDLIRQYFSQINVLYPILHEESFIQTYEDMAKGDNQEYRPSYLALLNIVLALAQTTIPTPNGAQERMRVSEYYYKRAASICKRPPVRGFRLETSMCSCCATCVARS